MYGLLGGLVSRMMLELDTAGNIRLEEGRATDLWYASCSGGCGFAVLKQRKYVLSSKCGAGNESMGGHPRGKRRGRGVRVGAGSCEAAAMIGSKRARCCAGGCDEATVTC